MFLQIAVMSLLYWRRMLCLEWSLMWAVVGCSVQPCDGWTVLDEVLCAVLYEVMWVFVCGVVSCAVDCAVLWRAVWCHVTTLWDECVYIHLYVCTYVYIYIYVYMYIYIYHPFFIRTWCFRILLSLAFSFAEVREVELFCSVSSFKRIKRARSARRF